MSEFGFTHEINTYQYVYVISMFSLSEKELNNNDIRYFFYFFVFDLFSFSCSNSSQLFMSEKTFIICKVLNINDNGYYVKWSIMIITRNDESIE